MAAAGRDMCNMPIAEQALTSVPSAMSFLECRDLGRLASVSRSLSTAASSSKLSWKDSLSLAYYQARMAMERAIRSAIERGDVFHPVYVNYQLAHLRSSRVLQAIMQGRLTIENALRHACPRDWPIGTWLTVFAGGYTVEEIRALRVRGDANEVLFQYNMLVFLPLILSVLMHVGGVHLITEEVVFPIRREAEYLGLGPEEIYLLRRDRVSRAEIVSVAPWFLEAHKAVVKTTTVPLFAIAWMSEAQLPALVARWEALSDSERNFISGHRIAVKNWDFLHQVYEHYTLFLWRDLRLVMSVTFDTFCMRYLMPLARAVQLSLVNGNVNIRPLPLLEDSSSSRPLLLTDVPRPLLLEDAPTAEAVGGAAVPSVRR